MAKPSGDAPKAGKSGASPKASGASPKASGSSPKASGSSSKASGKATAATRPVQPAASPRTSATHEKFPVTCSECYEEFTFDSGVPGDSIICPICSHAARRPDDPLLNRIADLKGAEKRKFMMAFLAFLLSLGSFLAWIVLIDDPKKAADDAMFWGPVGASVLFLLVTVVFGLGYEKSRWETYF